MWSRRCSEERKEEKEKIKRCAHIFAKRQTHMQQNFVLEFVETLFFTFLPLYLFIVLLGFWRVGHYRGWHSKKEGNTTPPFLRAAYPRWLDEVLCIFPFVFATYRQRQKAGERKIPPPPLCHTSSSPSLTPFSDDCIQFSASFSFIFFQSMITHKNICQYFGLRRNSWI